MPRKRNRLEDVACSIEAIALEYPSVRLARALSGFASQLNVLGQGLTYGLLRRRWLARLSLLRTFRVALYHPYLAVLVVVLGVALTAPVLWRGWGVTDDTLHRTMLLSSTLVEALKGQFVFLNPSRNAQLMDLGVVPWWALEEASAAFFRPLASLTHWVDYRLWPDSSFLMHAHNLLWYGGLCGLVTLAYRRFMGRGAVSGLAAVLFAADITHLSCVASLSGRNSLMTLLFGVLALLCHDRWRRQGRRAYLLLALLSLLLALLSAEAGLAIVAYLFSYAVCMERGTWRQKLGSLVPYGLLVTAWRFVYQRLGYGAWGSGFYIDPGRESLRFALSALEVGPVLLFGQWIVLEPGLYALLSPWTSLAFWLVAVLALAFIARMLLPLLRQDRVARFWGLGMLLALVPIGAVSLPNGRLLTFVGLGAMGLMAQFVAGLYRRAAWVPARRTWRAHARTFALLLLGLHVVLSPFLLFCAHTILDPFFGSVTGLGALPQAEGQDVIVVNMPSPGNSIYLAGLRQVYGQSAPAHMRILAPGYAAVEVTRVDAHALVVRPDRGYLAPADASGLGGQDVFPLAHPAYGYQRGDRLFRSDSYPMRKGQRVDLTGMSVEVTALTKDGRPTEARIQFAVSLDDPSLQWLQWEWTKGAYVPFTPPAIGETVVVPGPF